MPKVLNNQQENDQDFPLNSRYLERSKGEVGEYLKIAPPKKC